LASVRAAGLHLVVGLQRSLPAYPLAVGLSHGSSSAYKNKEHVKVNHIYSQMEGFNRLMQNSPSPNSESPYAQYGQNHPPPQFRPHFNHFLFGQHMPPSQFAQSVPPFTLSVHAKYESF
jgi:hypothetical protein